MAQPASTLLEAEIIQERDHARAVYAHGDHWRDFAAYTVRRFPDTPAGLKQATSWCEKYDVYGDGRIIRLRLRENWRQCRDDFRHEETGEVFEGGDWVSLD